MAVEICNGYCITNNNVIPHLISFQYTNEQLKELFALEDYGLAAMNNVWVCSHLGQDDQDDAHDDLAEYYEFHQN